MGQIQQMCQAGDVRIDWNPAREDEVKVAEKAFKEHTRKGGMAFRMWNDGKKGDQLHDFDKYAERILLVPAVVGG